MQQLRDLTNHVETHAFSQGFSSSNEQWCYNQEVHKVLPMSCWATFKLDNFPRRVGAVWFCSTPPLIFPDTLGICCPWTKNFEAFVGAGKRGVEDGQGNVYSEQLSNGDGFSWASKWYIFSWPDWGSMTCCWASPMLTGFSCGFSNGIMISSPNLLSNSERSHGWDFSLMSKIYNWLWHVSSAFNIHLDFVSAFCFCSVRSLVEKMLGKTILRLKLSCCNVDF